MTEIWFRRAARIGLPVVLLVGAGCSGGDDKGATTTSTAAQTTTSTAPTTTSVPLTKEQIVLAADGVGTVKFGTDNAANILKRFVEALGQPEKDQRLPAATACGATRRFVWANFQILVNEVTSMSGAGRPGFAGWYLGPATAAPLDFKTEKGIGVGSTVAALKAAYGDSVSVQARGEDGPAFTITEPTGIIVGLLTLATDAGKVKDIQAGNYCGPA
jgi:hypothetical protein